MQFEKVGGGKKEKERERGEKKISRETADIKTTLNIKLRERRREWEEDGRR